MPFRFQRRQGKESRASILGIPWGVCTIGLLQGICPQAELQITQSSPCQRAGCLSLAGCHLFSAVRVREQGALTEAGKTMHPIPSSGHTILCSHLLPSFCSARGTKRGCFTSHSPQTPTLCFYLKELLLLLPGRACCWLWLSSSS